MSNTLIDSLLPGLDSVLGVRDSIGAVKDLVYIITRTWSGSKPGDGIATDTREQILPTPGIKDYAHDIRLQEGGSLRQGDIILRGISKSSYPVESQIDCSTSSKRIEKFYFIDDRLYVVINVKDLYVTWDVQIRKTSNPKTYGNW